MKDSAPPSQLAPAIAFPRARPDGKIEKRKPGRGGECDVVPAVESQCRLDSSASTKADSIYARRRFRPGNSGCPHHRDDDDGAVANLRLLSPLDITFIALAAARWAKSEGVQIEKVEGSAEARTDVSGKGGSARAHVTGTKSASLPVWSCIASAHNASTRTTASHSTSETCPLFSGSGVAPTISPPPLMLLPERWHGLSNRVSLPRRQSAFRADLPEHHVAQLHDDFRLHAFLGTFRHAGQVEVGQLVHRRLANGDDVCGSQGLPPRWHVGTIRQRSCMDRSPSLPSAAGLICCALWNRYRRDYKGGLLLVQSPRKFRPAHRLPLEACARWSRRTSAQDRAACPNQRLTPPRIL